MTFVQLRVTSNRETNAMPDDKPTVRVRPYGYQPTKEELEEDLSVEASPEEARGRPSCGR